MLPKEFAKIKTTKCKGCGSEFTQYRNQLFCSHKCYIEFTRNNPERSRRVEYVALICPVCNKEFQRNRQQVKSDKSYCSRKCAGTVSGGKAQRSKTSVASTYKKCLSCGKEFKTHGGKDSKYCSRLCFNKHRSENGWGDNNPNYRHGTNRSTAISVAKRHFNMSCMICGFDIAVTIHHIKPISDGGKNNPDNLSVLCPNHHAMVHKGLIQDSELISITSKHLEVTTQ